MTSLRQALLDHHLIVLRILGEWYELDLIGQDKEACAAALGEAILAVELREEMVYLQLEESAALRALAAAKGRLPVATFSRQFGEVRQMGPGKLEREEPWLNPVSPAESLWYRGLLFRGFDESDTGLVEYYFIPDELLPKIVAAIPSIEKPVSPAKKVTPLPQNDEQGMADALADVARFIQKTKAKQGGKVAKVQGGVGVERQSGNLSIAPRQQTVSKPISPPLAKPKSVVPVSSTSADRIPASFQPATTLAVDDLTTVLALAQREPLQLPAQTIVAPFLRDPDPDRLTFLIQLALDAGLLRNNAAVLRPTRAAVDWLRESREAQLGLLFTRWQTTGWAALRHIKQLACEGEWQHDPTAVRRVLLQTLPRTTEWNALDALIANIYQNKPDFQRPDGDYSTWYIRDVQTNEFLTGFASWQAVEGRLLEYVLLRPMIWLGLLERSTDEKVKAVRFHARALAFLEKRLLPAKMVEPALVIQPNAVLQIPLAASCYQRFQATRIAEPLPVEGQKPYQLRITPQSLQQAQDQGITPPRVLQFLQQVGGNRPIPISVKRAIERWAEHGTEGRLERATILRVADPLVLETLRNNPKTRDLLGEVLG
ncbi:MAG TPA: hypothetical protein ENJ56_09195, partial [Anaerolineae bacterium]|nr:hypothetical protein [Anaerolineae bacterium]